MASYATARAGFYDSLEPLDDDASAPPVARAMLAAGLEAGVGPMAAVAGALAEAVGRALAEEFRLHEVVVENGGDLWLSLREPLVAAVYAGLSSLSGTFGVRLGPGDWGLGCSSATVGPSLSLGQADAAVALARGGATADAWATALGNASTSRTEPGRGIAALWAGGRRPLGALVVTGPTFSAAGELVLAPLALPR